jgi:hypothetical protein
VFTAGRVTVLPPETDPARVAEAANRRAEVIAILAETLVEQLLAENRVTPAPETGGPVSAGPGPDATDQILRRWYLP